MIVQGLPLRQEIAPGDCTVPVTRRKVIFLMAMLVEAFPAGPQFPARIT